MKHLKKCLAAAITLAAVLLFAMGAAALDTAGLDATSAVGSFKVEQAYVNVPEMNVYFYATDGEGNSYSPSLVKAAGVQLKIGETHVDASSIGVAADPICYIIAIDNSDHIPQDQFRKTVNAVRKLAFRKGENDQFLLYTTAGETKCVQQATSDKIAIFRALAGLEQAEGSMDLTDTARAISADIQRDYQALAPRRVAFICSNSTEILSSITLLGTLMSDVSNKLNMALYAFLGAEKPGVLETVSKLTDGRVIPCTPDEMGDKMVAEQAYLGTALEIRTELPESMYGTRLETMTMSVPALGSAISSATTVYMGYKQEKPSVVGTAILGRNKIMLTFNQPVSENAEKPAYYSIVSEDIWGWHVRITDVDLAEDGRTAILKTEPLYQGKYNISLNKVSARMTPANMSAKNNKTSINVLRWPHDRKFYLARFRIPLTVAAVLLLVLAWRWLRQSRRDRLAEKYAEAEHLLNDNPDDAAPIMPRRYATIFFGKRGSIAESRWSGMVEGSMMLGSDAAQCDLCLPDKKVGPQHCVLAVAGESLSVTPLEGRVVLVNGERIAGEHKLQNNDKLKIGKTSLELVL